jgi:hypothetical protein
MSSFALVLLVAVPVAASAEVWRWKDAGGQTHYSNVPGHVPAHASPVRGELGLVGGEPIGEAGEAVPAVSADRLREERTIRRRLAEIQSFYDQVRARQLARLSSYATSTLLPDWLVADRWLSLKEEESRLRGALATLERRRSDGS